MAKRPQRNLFKLRHSSAFGRMKFFNHRLSRTEHLAPLAEFLPQNFLPWVLNTLKAYFKPRTRFRDYSKSSKTGIYDLTATSARIAIAGDWGTGTQEAETVMEHMMAADPDLTIHIGDVYFVGDEPEIQENCFGKHRHGYDGVKWRCGRLGSFALNGNHEMFADGGPYFRTFLPTLGMKDDPGQVASFFAINVGAWRIVAIDTGYNSVGIPILSMIPWINGVPFIGGDCHLPRKHMRWLKDVVAPQNNLKPTLLLSHHQYFSAFPDEAYTRPARQLKPLFGEQEILWLWGHEHRLAIYGKSSKPKGVTAFGRCIGHGGMPVEVGEPNPNKAPIQFFDPRFAVIDGEKVGKNGFVLVTIANDVLTIEYKDVDNRLIFAESFEPRDGGRQFAYRLVDQGILQPVKTP